MKGKKIKMSIRSEYSDRKTPSNKLYQNNKNIWEEIDRN